MAVADERKELRSLLELTKLADELVEPFLVAGAYSTKALLMKALECIEVFKSNCSSKDPAKCEQAFICYTSASKLVSQVIPALPDFNTLNRNPDLWQFYNDLVDYLVRKRDVYDEIRRYIQLRTSSGDSLLMRFQNLKNTESSPSSSPSPTRSALPSPPSVPSTEFDALSSRAVVSVNELTYLLDRSSCVLLIDFRRKREFDLDHIRRTDSIVQIEPVSVRINYTCRDIEDFSMVTNSVQERQLFHSRDSFELVVCIDRSSSKNNVQPDLGLLMNILQNKPDSRRLKRPPVFLDGGYAQWENVNGQIKSPTKARSRHGSQPQVQPIPIPGAYDELKLIRNVSEYFATPRYASPTPSQTPMARSKSNSYAPPATLPRQQSFHQLQAPNMPQRPPLPPQKQLQAPMIMTGLTNLGNSCYMNSGVQGLMGALGLVEFFLTGNYKAHINVNSRLGSKGILANEFASLCNEMYKHTNESRPTYINTAHFRRVIASLNSTFNNCEQQDCSEFLTYMLDSLHEDLNENGNHPPLPELTKEEEEQREALPVRIASTIEWERYLKTNFSIIVDIFEGQMMSQLKCLRCGTTSTNYSSFSALSVPIPKHKKSITLEDCLDEFVKPEILDGDDMWFCPHCKNKQVASKQLKISRLPQVLVIHLKRFSMGNYLSKINNNVAYQEHIQLDKYWPKVETEFQRAELAKLPTRGQVAPFKYNLFGVINHFGTLKSGHYTAYVRKGRHGWCLFEDQVVYKHCKTSKVINGNAYILFYAREN